MTTNLTEETVSSEVVFQGRLLTIRVDTVRLPNGKLAKREIAGHGGAVAMIPVLPDGRVALVRQWRTAAGQALLEIPAGGLEAGEDPAECAARELMEEISYRPGKLTKLVANYLAPGYSSELLHLYLAEELTPESLEQDEDENLEIVALSWAEINQMLLNGEFNDAKTIAGLLLAKMALNARG